MNAHYAELIAKERAIELRRDAEQTRLGGALRRPVTRTPDVRPRLPSLIGRLAIAVRHGLA